MEQYVFPFAEQSASPNSTTQGDGTLLVSAGEGSEAAAGSSVPGSDSSSPPSAVCRACSLSPVTFTSPVQASQPRGPGRGAIPFYSGADRLRDSFPGATERTRTGAPLLTQPSALALLTQGGSRCHTDSEPDLCRGPGRPSGGWCVLACPACLPLSWAVPQTFPGHSRGAGVEPPSQDVSLAAMASVHSAAVPRGCGICS